MNGEVIYRTGLSFFYDENGYMGAWEDENT